MVQFYMNEWKSATNMNEWKSATNSFRIHNRVVPSSARWPTLCPWSRCATLFTLQRCFSRRPTPPTTLLRSTWRPENLIGRMVTWLSPSSTQKKDGAAVARGTNCTVSKAIFHKSEPTGLWRRVLWLFQLSSGTKVVRQRTTKSCQSL